MNPDTQADRDFVTAAHKDAVAMSVPTGWKIYDRRGSNPTCWDGLSASCPSPAEAWQDAANRLRARKAAQAGKPEPEPERIVLVLVDADRRSAVPAANRLRSALKVLLRRFGFRVVQMQEPVKPPAST